MPTAPTLDGQQIQTAPLRGGKRDANVSPDVYGAGMAQGVSSLANDTQRIWNQAQDQANQSALNDAQAQADAQANDLQREHQGLSGENAISQADAIKAKWATATGDIVKKTLTNGAQRQAFAQWQAHRTNSFNSAIDDHALREGQQQQGADYQARVATAVQRAVLNKDSPEQQAAAFADMDAATQGFAAVRGATPVQVQALSQQNAGAFYGGIITAHLDAGNDLAAARVLDAHKGEMDAQTVLQMSKATDMGSTMGEGQRQAAAIYSPGKTLEAMYAEADGIENQKVQEETKARIATKYRIHKQTVADDQDQSFQEGWKTLITTGDLSAITAPERVRMGDDKFGALDAAAARMNRREEVKSDGYRFYELQTLSSVSATRDDFLKTNLAQEYAKGNIDRSEFKDLSGLQTSLRNTADKARQDQLTSGITTRNEVVNRAMVAAGLDPEDYVRVKGKVVSNPKSIEFRRQLDRALAGMVEPGKEPTPDQVQAAADGLLIDHPEVITGYIWNTPKHTRAFEMPGAGQVAYSPRQVPKEFWDQKVSAADARGEQLSDTDIMAMWNASVVGGAHAK
jgi:hypothetical protein